MNCAEKIVLKRAIMILAGIFMSLLVHKLIANEFVIDDSTFDNLITPSHIIEKLPYSFDKSWQICIQNSDATSQQCKNAPAGIAVEEIFSEFNGYIIYRTQFRVSLDYEYQPLAMYINTIRDSDEFYINGKLVAKTGSFPPDFKKATLYPRTYFIPSNLLRFDANNEVLFKIYNHAREGGIYNQVPVLDSASSIAKKSSNKQNLIILYIGMLILISTVQLFYYFSQIANKEYLYFSIICIAEVFYLLTYTEIAQNSGVNLNIIFRSNIFLYAFLNIVFCIFITQFFKFIIGSILKTGLLVLGALAVLSFIVPINYIYYIVSAISLLAVVLFAPFYFFLFFRSIKNQLPYAVVMAITVGFFILTVLIDILIDSGFLEPFKYSISGLISPISLLILFIAIILILTHRHWLFYRSATYDYLTKALRRTAFIERLFQEIYRAQRSYDHLLVAVLKLEDFQEIKDTYSHEVRDEILLKISQSIRRTLREFDLLGRYDKSAFCLAATVSDKSHAVQLLKRLHKNLTLKPFEFGQQHRIKLSITVGGYVKDSQDQVTALQTLEKAHAIQVQGTINQKGRIHI